MTRVLVAGASGQVGTYLVPELADCDLVTCGHADLDIADRHAVDAWVTKVAPDLIINAAGMTDVDGCEGDPERAYAVNALGVRWLALAASRTDAHLVHISTDYVFDGHAREPYREWEATGPISIYGKSKLGGELECMQHASSWTIARTAWVFGARGYDFVSWVLTADARQELRGIVNDQTGSPTYAADLARVLAQLGTQRVPGMFHVVNAGTATRHELGVAALASDGRDASGVPGIPASDLPRPAPRPAYSALADTALAAAGIAPMRPWQDALQAYLAAT